MLNTRSFSLTLAAFATLGFMSAHPAAAQTNIVYNGSFEVPAPASSPSVDQVVTNWTLAGNVSRETGAGQYYVGASDGNSAIAFNSGNSFVDGTLSQTLGTATVLGTQYSLSFDYGNYAGVGENGGGQSVLVTVTGTGGTLLSETVTPIVGGNGYGTSGVGGKANYGHYTYDFTGDGVKDTLTFTDKATDGRNSDGALDVVSITQNTPASAAPEPSQIAMLGFVVLGMAGLLLKACKRSAAPAPAV